MRDSVSQSCEARLVFNLYLEDINGLVGGEMRRIFQEEKAKQEEEERVRKEAAKEDDLKRLEKLKNDLTPEAYQRRLSKILSS